MMIHPSSLMRLAAFAGIALLASAVVRESNAREKAPARLPPPGKAQALAKPRRRPIRQD